MITNNSQNICIHKWVPHHTGGSEQVPTICCFYCGEINWSRYTLADAMYQEKDVDSFIDNASKNGKRAILKQVIQSLADLHDTLFKTIAGNNTLAGLEAHLVHERRQFALLERELDKPPMTLCDTLK